VIRGEAKRVLAMANRFALVQKGGRREEERHHLKFEWDKRKAKSDKCS
jgi:hypothetical protein